MGTEHFTPEQEAQLAGLLATTLQKPPRSLSEKLSVAEIIRKWIWITLVCITVVSSQVFQVGLNSIRLTTLEKKMKEIRPLVRRHEWQAQQGLTNHDLKERGMTAPEFREDD